MVTEENKPNNQADKIFTGEEETILSNLEALRDEGSLASLGAMLEHLTTQPSEPIKLKILELIADLKIPEASAIVANFTFACKSPTLQQELVAASWQSRMEFGHYLNKYIDLAIEGNMMLALDVISLVEESCEKVEMEQLKVAVSAINRNLKSFDDQKLLLMQDMVLILEEKIEAQKQ